MADDPAGDQPASDPPDPDKPDDVFTRPEDEAGKKALEAERSARREAERRLKEFEDAGKSELEKATTAAAEAAKRAEEAELRALRLEIASDKGLTPSQARRLVGNTKEELEADADQLLADFPAAQPPPAHKLPHKPKAPGSLEPKGPEALEGKGRAAAALREMRHTR